MLTLAHRAMLGAASRPKPPVQIIGASGAGTATDAPYASAFDADGNRVVVGSTGIPGFVAKFDQDGILLWQRALTLTVSCTIQCVYINASTGDIYIGGSGRLSGSIDSAYFAKYNASGVLQWQRKMSAAYHVRAQACVLDSAGNVFFAVHAQNTKQVTVIAKYSSGGALQWQRAISHATVHVVPGSAIAIDISGNLYFPASVNESPLKVSVIKCNSSGVVQAVYAQYTGTSQNSIASCVLDGDGNIYIAGNARPDSQRAFVCKLNASGVVQWHRWVDGGTTSFSGLCLSGAHVFAAGSGFLFSFATADGALAFQRELKGPSTSNSASVSAADGFLLHCSAMLSMPGTNTDAITAKLPDDGSGLGTYGSLITYSESAFTSNVGSPTAATPTVTDAAGALTEAAGDMTDAAGTLTITPYL